jgi:hypothetical protein
MPSKTDPKGKAAAREAPADRADNPTGSKDLSKRTDKPDRHRAGPSRGADNPADSRDRHKAVHLKAEPLKEGKPVSRQLCRQEQPERLEALLSKAGNPRLLKTVNLNPKPTGRNSLPSLPLPRSLNKRKRSRQASGEKSSR